MTTLAHARVASFASVTESEWGKRIQARLDALDIKPRQFYDETGISRDTLRKAIAGDPTVRPKKLEEIEEKLAVLERRAEGFHGLSAADPEDDLISFELSGNFGVRVVVKGPIRDQAALEASVTRLIREMRGDADDR